MGKISKESQETLDRWKLHTDSVTANDIFEFAEHNGISQTRVYQFFDVDQNDLEEARKELVDSL